MSTPFSNTHRNYNLSPLDAAFNDIKQGIANFRLWRALSTQDIKLKYRRSTLGPFWITLSMAVTLAAMGPLYGLLFHVDLKSFIPNLGLGLIFWGFIAASMTEYSEAFTSSEHLLKQSYLPLSTLILRVFYRQVLILLHNLIIYPILIILLGITINWNFFWIIPGFCLVSLNVLWLGLLIAIFCTRYRDMMPIIQSLITLLFFVTPIIWNISQLPPERVHIASINPFTALISLVRKPLLGQMPDTHDWIIASIMLVIGLIITIPAFVATRRKITYWL